MTLDTDTSRKFHIQKWVMLILSPHLPRSPTPKNKPTNKQVTAVFNFLKLELFFGETRLRRHPNLPYRQEVMQYTLASTLDTL